jgi:sn-glycerol 3-phosphate transport system substrate-binding protein
MKPLRRALLSLSLVTALGATALGAAADAAAQQRVKFEMWHGLTGDLGERVADVCKRFNGAQAEFEIVCISQGSYDQAVQNSIAAFRAKKHPTVVQVFDAGTADLMLSGAFYPATKLMADHGYNVDWNRYFPGIANYYATSKGEMYSFPFNSSTAMLYWNRDALAKVGRTEAPKTWEDVEAIARDMKKAGIPAPFCFEHDTWQILEQFSAIHRQPIATKGNGYEGLDAELVFNKTRFVDYVKFLKKGLDEGIFAIKEKATGATIGEAFAAGECQMTQMSIASHATIGKTAKPGVNWDVAMLPLFAGTERTNSLVGGASLWALSGKSKDEYRAAAAFFEFIAKPESEEYFSTITGYIPVTIPGFKFMTDKGFYANPPYKGRELALASLTASAPTEVSRGIRLGGFIQIRKETRDALQAIFADKMTVQAGLDQAVERGNAILRRFERTYAGKQLP